MAGNFEAKLHGFRRTQDGVVISYTVHPNDVSAELAVAALGTRYMIGFSELGDDDRPVAEQVDAGDLKSPSEGSAGSIPAGSTKKDRKPFASLPLTQQAAMRCEETTFMDFALGKWRALAIGIDKNSADAADWVRQVCGVDSRSEIIKNTPAGDRWESLERDYQSWLVTSRYQGSIR